MWLQFSCEQCHYSATTKGNLEIHIRGVHEKRKPFKCTDCDYASATKGNLDIHVKGVHKKIKAYQCNQCEYAATTKGNLDQHVRYDYSLCRNFFGVFKYSALVKWASI